MSMVCQREEIADLERRVTAAWPTASQVCALSRRPAAGQFAGDGVEAGQGMATLGIVSRNLSPTRQI
jgi:hypothetical protein